MTWRHRDVVERYRARDVPGLRWRRADGPGELNLHLRKGSASSSPVVSVTIDQLDGCTRVTAWASRSRTRFGAMSYARPSICH